VNLGATALRSPIDRLSPREAALKTPFAILPPRLHANGERRSTNPTASAWQVSTGCVSDADLIARARRGDSAAFGELVDRHCTAVYRATLAVLGSHEEAEDAAQDAFVVAFERLASFRGDASFKTWLLTIAWRQDINRRRSLTRWWRRTRDEQAAAEDVASRAPSPEDAAATDELRGAIVAEIRGLSQKLRDTLLLAQAGELSYEDIAAMTNVPVGTVKWRVSEARKMIRKRLRERGFEDVADR
jgi:RNA polymerase sigma-70 factor (ECF subfamily)